MRKNNKDEETLRQLDAQRQLQQQKQQQHMLALRPSSESRLIQQERHSTTSGGGDEYSVEQEKSCWEYEVTTPMTTRPHFSPAASPVLSRSFNSPRRHSQWARGRSRSLGNEPAHGAPASLLLPPLKTIISNQAFEVDEERIVHHATVTTQKDELELVEDDEKHHDAASAAERHATFLEPPTAIALQPPLSPASLPPGDKFQVPKHSTATNGAPSSSSSSSSSLLVNLLYGVINASIVLPVLMSFASIIYQDALYAPYMPILVQLTILSGMVHQTCFSLFSSLPFAVGSVQDAGLIFLSSMTSDLVRTVTATNTATTDADTTTTVLLATTLVALSLGTALLGCGLILVGRWKLAQYVQLLPTSVVAGYLAYIGWFCGLSGIRLMSGQSALSWAVLQERWRLIVPGVVGGMFIYCSVRRLRHMAVLPSCILLLLLVFYVGLWTTQTSIEAATEQGWIRASNDSAQTPAWYNTWQYFQFDHVLWSALPRLLLTELGMIFVVALSSSLDVAAIELEVKRPLDYNQELTTVGISNLVSGLTGGYTGSYIFSQTIFSLRAGITSRTAGFALAACELLVLVAPVPILSFVPNFLFGALLTLICVDLLYEWLWDVRTRVTKTEHGIDWATFALIQWLGVEYGILAGILVYLACQKLGWDVGGNQLERVEVEAVGDEERDQTTKLLSEDEHPSHENGTTAQYGSL